MPEQAEWSSQASLNLYGWRVRENDEGMKSLSMRSRWESRLGKYAPQLASALEGNTSLTSLGNTNDN